MSTPTDHMQRIIEEGRYAISGILGSGGMGIVYLARDRVLGREVALKVLREPYVGSEEFVVRFRREANNAAALSHPNIVSVYDRSEQEDGPHYIAMEYVSGGTLTERISREAPLPPDEAARIALQVANALNEAHRRGIVHRDIKSENILLTEEGFVKVADFGIARAAEATAMTHTGQVFGTVSYVSPEQAAGDEVGPESDLYSLGILLYEMLTGEVPFKAESPIGVAIKHVREVPVPVEQKNPKVPEELAALTMALLSKDPAARPSPARRVAAQLDRFLEGDAANAPANASAGAVASNSASAPVDAGGGTATRVMERVTSAGAVFRRGRTAALLCAIAVLPLAVIFALPLYDPAGQDTSSALTPIREPKVASVGIPDGIAPNIEDTLKLEDVVLEEHSSSPARNPEEKQGEPSVAESSGAASSNTEASVIAEQPASGSSATSSATPSATPSVTASAVSPATSSATASATSPATSSATASATARPAPVDTAPPATSRPVVRSPAGSATASTSNPPRAREPSPQPQPEPAPTPTPTPTPAPEPVAPDVPGVTVPVYPSAGAVPGVPKFSGGTVRPGP